MGTFLENWASEKIEKQKKEIAHLTKQRDELAAALEELMYARTDKAERMAEAALPRVKGQP